MHEWRFVSFYTKFDYKYTQLIYQDKWSNLKDKLYSTMNKGGGGGGGVIISHLTEAITELYTLYICLKHKNQKKNN